MTKQYHRESKWKFPFVSYTSQLKSNKIPLIIQLHGAAARGNGEDDLCLVETLGLGNHISDYSDREFMLVMPQCPKGSFWAARVESLMDFIAQLKAEYNIDEDRVYLTGFSMGGYGTWFTAMSKPELFAAIIPICGGGMCWNSDVLTMPTWVFHGSEDKRVPTVYSELMVEGMRSHGLDVTYTRIDGAGHHIWNDVYNADLLDWLLSHKRQNK